MDTGGVTGDAGNAPVQLQRQGGTPLLPDITSAEQLPLRPHQSRSAPGMLIGRRISSEKPLKQ